MAVSLEDVHSEEHLANDEQRDDDRVSTKIHSEVNKKSVETVEESDNGDIKRH